VRIAIVGNCHGNIIAQVVRKALDAEADVDCRHIVNDRRVEEADRAFIDTADRVLLQVVDFKGRNAAVTGENLRPGVVGLFPLIACNFIYPFAGRAHPRSHESRSDHCPSGYYEGQSSDSVLMDLMEKHPDEPVEAVVDRYLEVDCARLVDLDRLYELNRLKMQRIGAAAGLDLWPKIERGFRDAPMFWTYLHPAGGLLRSLCRHALEQLRLGLTAVAIDTAVDSVREPFGFFHMPIHPSIARHFGIEWASATYRYRSMPEGAFTIRQFARRFIRFENCDPVNWAIVSLHAGRDLAAAIDVLERARQELPDSGDILMNLSVAYWKQGRLPEAMAAATLALEGNPHDADWALFVCVIARQMGLLQAGSSLPAKWLADAIP